MMEYKGYTAKIEFDDEANLFHGQVINMRDVITFQGQSVDELRGAFADSVEDYLEFCAERNEEPEKPFSGRFVVRTDPSLHRDIAIAALRANQSINAWINDVLTQAVRQRPTTHQVSVNRDFVQQISTTFELALSSILELQPLSNRSTSNPKAKLSIRKSTILSPGNTVSISKLGQLVDMQEVVPDAC